MGNTPNIRFKGFTNDWEQRKVSDVAKIIAGGTPSTKENSYWEPKEIPWLSSGEVHKKYITFTDDMISQIGMNNSSAKMVAKDSVLIALAGQGKTRGTVAINRIPLTTNQSIAAMTFNENFIPEFVFYNLENRYDELRRMSSGDGSRGGLNKQLVGDIEIPYTEKKEQERIGSFFESLDRIITLHQRKSFLYFSRINDWEQRKLNEYLQVSKVKNKDAAFSKEDVLSVSGDYGIVNQIEFQGRSFAGVSVAAYGVVETGDVVYTKSPLKSNPYGIIKTNKGKTGIVSTLYAVYKPLNNVHSEFVQIYFEQDARMNNYMHSLVNKGAKNDMKVSDENALKGEVFFPSKDEQIKISKYFGKIDHLITLHRRAYYNKKGGLTNVHNDNQQYYAIL